MRLSEVRSLSSCCERLPRPRSRKPLRHHASQDCDMYSSQAQPRGMPDPSQSSFVGSAARKFYVRCSLDKPALRLPKSCAGAPGSPARPFSGEDRPQRHRHTSPCQQAPAARGKISQASQAPARAREREGDSGRWSRARSRVRG